MTRQMNYYTTKSGYTVEYSIVGNGEPILVLHGGHSSCNEDFGYGELTGRGFSVITPSRPGYGKTSKELGKDVASACEAYSELLGALGIPQVHVIAISAGGPSGIHFAARFPNKSRSLILQSAVADKWLSPDDKLYKAARYMFRPSMEFYIWGMMRIMNRFFPSFLFKSMLPSFSKMRAEEALKHFGKEDRIRFKKMIDRQRSGSGFMIDLEQTGHDPAPDLAAVRCPALILHSVHDASVPVEHARHAHRLIPNAQLCELETWGHLIWIGKGSEEMHEKLFRFLGTH